MLNILATVNLSRLIGTVHYHTITGNQLACAYKDHPFVSSRQFEEEFVNSKIIAGESIFTTPVGCI